METAPVTSASHAEGMSFSLIMLITVHGLMPQFHWIEFQHWTAVDSAMCGS